MIQMESKWHQMEVPNCSKIKSKWRASEWVVANCHAVSCMQRTCSISIEIFLKLWASKKKKSLWKLSQSNQHKIFWVYRASRSLSRQVPKNPLVVRARATFSSKLPFHFHTSFWTSFWVPFGPLLAPLWLPKGLPDSPKRLQMHPKCSKMED